MSLWRISTSQGASDVKDEEIESIRERAAKRKLRVVAHVSRSYAEAEGWDLEYWQRQTPQQRLSALVAIHRDVAKARRSAGGAG